MPDFREKARFQAEAIKETDAALPVRRAGGERVGREAERSCVSRHLKQTVVFLRVDQRERLRTVVDRSGVPVAALVREGIDLALARFGGCQFVADAAWLGVRRP